MRLCTRICVPPLLVSLFSLLIVTGAATTLLCPGEELNDGLCDVERLREVALSREVSVETSSWAITKAICR